MAPAAWKTASDAPVNWRPSSSIRRSRQRTHPAAPFPASATIGGDQAQSAGSGSCPWRRSRTPRNSSSGRSPSKVHAVRRGTSQVYLRLDQQVCGLVKSARAWPHASRCRRTAAGSGRPAEGRRNPVRGGTAPRRLREADDIKPGVSGPWAHDARHGSQGPAPHQRDHLSANKPGLATHVKPQHAADAARPWPSVKQPTVRTDRDGARIPSAIRPWTPRHAVPQRDKMTHHGTQNKRPA